MLKRIRESFDNGVEKIKWVSSVVADRARVELSVIKLLYETDKLEKRKNELMRQIGQRVFELKEYPDRHILRDSVITGALAEIDQIATEIEMTKKKASEISKLEE